MLVLLDMDGEYLSQVRRDVRVIRLYEDLRDGRPAGQGEDSEVETASTNKIDRNEHARDSWRGRILSRGWMKRMVAPQREDNGILKDVRSACQALQPHFQKLLLRERPEAIVAHLLMGNSVALHANSGQGIFTVVCMHNTLKDYQTREEFRHSPLDKADAVVTVSHTIGEIFQKKVGKEKVHVIHNPHDLHQIQELAKEMVTHPWFVQKDLPLVVGIGRLSRQKHFSSLVDAVCALNRKGACPVRLVLFGDGPDRDRLARLIHKNDRQDRVRLMGWAANPFRYLSRADLFVLCSEWEGLPNTLIEAMGCGVPVISTDCASGPREILQDGVCGRLLTRGDTRVLQEAIAELLQDPRKAEAFRAKGRQRAWDFDISVQVPCYEKLIIEGVGKKQERGHVAP